MQAPLPWRPLGTSDQTHIRNELDAALMAWNSHWIPQVRLTVKELDYLPPRVEPESQGWVWVDAQQSMACSTDEETTRLHALNVLRAMDQRNALADDRKHELLRRFGTQVLANLFERVAAGVMTSGWKTAGPRPCNDHINPMGGVRLRLFADGVASVDIFLSFVGLRLGHIVGRPIPRKKPELNSVKVALAGSHTRLSVPLGRASLTLAELAGLARGDVLVLDQAVEDLVSVFDGRQQYCFARASIHAANHRIVLKIAAQHETDVGLTTT